MMVNAWMLSSKAILGGILLSTFLLASVIVEKAGYFN